MSWGEKRTTLRAALAVGMAQLRAGNRWMLIVENPHVECGHQIFSPVDDDGQPVWTDAEIASCLQTVLDAAPGDMEGPEDPTA